MCNKLTSRMLRDYQGNTPNSEKTECIKGHRFDKINTWISRKTGKRQCKTCNRIRNDKRSLTINSNRL